MTDSAEEARTLTVDDAQDGARLDRVIAELVASRSQAQRLIADGRVTVDGAVAEKSRASVQLGQVIEVLVPADRPTAVQEHVDAVPTLFRDDSILVIDKPAGMVVHPAPGHRGTTLVELLAGQTAGGPAERPGVVHRLDRDTSGLLVMARTEQALRTLQKSIVDREIRREYRALVLGAPASRTGTIEAPIGRDPRDRTRMAIDGDAAREAVTHFEVLEYLPSTTLLSVVLDTGRTHQIRVHLEAIGHTVVGDPTYGDGPAFGVERQWLHAAQLTLPHPVTGEELSFSSQIPGDLQQSLAAARAAVSVV